MVSPWIIFILVLFLSYVTGSTPTSIIVGKLTKGIDIREHGSGNAGGTNVFRVLGWKPALVVVAVDVFKGWLPTAVYALHSINYINIGDVGILQILCGFFAVLGHTYPIFARFKGGKGVGRHADRSISGCYSSLSSCFCYNINLNRVCFPWIYLSILITSHIPIYPSSYYNHHTSTALTLNLFLIDPLVCHLYPQK